MSTAGRFRIVLAKEDFKFSCAHFTVFAEGQAELLHGHNYRVAVEVAGDRLGEHGLLVAIERLKKEIRRLCAELDSRTLVPADCPLVTVEERPGDAGAGDPGGGGAPAAKAEKEIRFDSRRYLLPAADVLVLPLANTTMELLSELLWRRLAPGLADTGGRVDTLAVSVEESAGQRCVYERQI